MSAPSSVPTSRRTTVPLTRSVLIVAALLLAGAALLGYLLGAQPSVHGHTLVGRAYVGEQGASVRVGSWAYSIPTGGEAVQWFDANGGHEGGTAPCLRTAGTYAWVRFGYSFADGPDDSSWRQVTWVRCIPHP